MPSVTAAFAPAAFATVAFAPTAPPHFPDTPFGFDRTNRVAPSPADGTSAPTNSSENGLNQYRVLRRDGREVAFAPEKIALALTKAYLASQDQQKGPTARSREAVAAVTANVVASLTRRRSGGAFHIEEIQDQVELELMRAGEYAIARRYVLYRDERARLRDAANRPHPSPEPEPRPMHVTGSAGELKPLDLSALRARLAAACAGLDVVTSEAELESETLGALYEGVPQAEINRAAILAARAKIETAPEYAFVAARLLLNDIAGEVLGREITHPEAGPDYAGAFADYLAKGIAAGRLAPALAEFDAERLAAALRPERDLKFAYMGLQTLYDRYLIHVNGRRIELPQWFWMRVAMGLAQREVDREARAIEFYEVISQFHFVPSTPTLFNSGTGYPQLSSCYLTTIEDNLGHIYDSIRDNALLSKFSGGLGNDWTQVRAMGAHIRSTNGQSQGIVPFLKVANDTAVAVNQGGKRQGAVCAYIEPWHLDIEEFLDLRKNTGDDRRRTHDMHTALWMPDLFFTRLKENGTWTLFSPDETPDLHDLCGRDFAQRYAHYEAGAAAGELRNTRSVPAQELWRKILTRLFETGHPWITFKDPSNLRSPQRHMGVVHSSNLCTEILLNTSRDEIAVCNLGSVNLAEHVTAEGLDLSKLRATITVAVRMLDNVIDINLYPVPEARASNLRHRPVGLGLMGFQDALHTLRLAYASPEAVGFADRSMEAISHAAILASSELARERGPYPSYAGSLWEQGIMPIDSLTLLDAERDAPVEVDRGASLDWTPVRAAVRSHGMRNSNVMAIAPTATISNIAGVSASIEPNFSNLFAKSNLSGDFTVINPYLVSELRQRGLWDRDMIDDLKYFDGALDEIDRIPAEIKALYATAFEIDAQWLIEAAARRQKWLDMGQSLNLYVANPTGPTLSELYETAWRKGLKTTYYLRTKAATQVEKSTLDINRKAIQPRWMKSRSASADIQVERGDSPAPVACSLDGDCEACQ